VWLIRELQVCKLPGDSNCQLVNYSYH